MGCGQGLNLWRLLSETRRNLSRYTHGKKCRCFIDMYLCSGTHEKHIARVSSKLNSNLIIIKTTVVIHIVFRNAFIMMQL